VLVPSLDIKNKKILLFLMSFPCRLTYLSTKLMPRCWEKYLGLVHVEDLKAKEKVKNQCTAPWPPTNSLLTAA
jgi:hypothetical protein